MKGQERTRKRRMGGVEVNVYDSNTQKFDAGGSILKPVSAMHIIKQCE